MPDGTPRAAGFGVRVIHSGVWGFASSPIVTEDEIRRITRMAIEVAKASAIAKKTRRAARAGARPIRSYWTHARWTNDPATMSRRPTSSSALQAVVDAAIKHKDVVSANAIVNFSTEWKYFASTEGSYIEQEIFSTTPNFSVTRQARRRDAARAASRMPGGTGGWELVEIDRMKANVDQIVDEAIEIARREADHAGREGSRPDAVAPGADDSRDRRASRPSSIASSATRRITPARAS